MSQGAIQVPPMRPWGLQWGRGHRCRVFGGRLGYRASYYSRGLGTRIAKLERRVPRDREGRFSTERLVRYQALGSEKALVSALAEMVQDLVKTLRKVQEFLGYRDGSRIVPEYPGSKLLHVSKLPPHVQSVARRLAAHLPTLPLAPQPDNILGETETRTVLARPAAGDHSLRRVCSKKLGVVSVTLTTYS